MKSLLLICLMTAGAAHAAARLTCEPTNPALKLTTVPAKVAELCLPDGETCNPADADCCDYCKDYGNGLFMCTAFGATR